MATAITAEGAMIGGAAITRKIGIEVIGTIVSIVVTENTPTKGGAIMGTTSTKDTDMNIRAIGVLGMSGTVMPREIPMFTKTVITTAIVFI